MTDKFIACSILCLHCSVLQLSTFFALISPGPDFFFVTQSAIRQSRTHALFAALGISLSILVWSICALSGLHFLFQKIACLQAGTDDFRWNLSTVFRHNYAEVST